MLLLLQSGAHPVALAVTFGLTLAVAVLAVYAWQAPRDRKAIADWLRRAPSRLGRAPGRLADSLAPLLSPRAWWAAVSRHRAAAALAVGAAGFVIAAPLVAYRESSYVRLAVHVSRMRDRAEGPTFWGPIIREGRPAIPFLIGQFSTGETAEDLALNRRLDSALRLTLEWLHSRQPFTTTPLPSEPAGRERWAHWWKENEANVPDLGRADDLYNAWRGSTGSPRPEPVEGRDNYHNTSPSLP